MSPSLSVYLCLLSFAICYWAGKRSLVGGLAAVIGVGYAYGITRANVPETLSHFVFDAGVIGVYAAQLFRRLSPSDKDKIGPVKPWLEFLIAWPLLLFLIPIQDLLIQFVGLRGNIFLLPFILLGARMTPEDRYRLALWIAAFNLAAFAIASSEFFFGLESFYPSNRVTELVYRTKDIVGYTAFRIPATFANAHSYGGTMVMGLPLLIGAVVQKHKNNFRMQLLVAGIVAALIGILMSAARTHFLVASVLIVIATFSLRSKHAYAVGWLILLCGIGWVVSGEQRLQRFMELRNTDSIGERISWSVNMNFVEIAVEYPFGNGLGGGGTSIPYFLQGRITNPVMMENEYARIMLEQGIMGLMIWIVFIMWLLTRRNPNPHNPWYLGRRLAWICCAAYFATGLIGTGLLTSVPQSCLFVLLIGWIAAREPVAEPAQVSAAYANGRLRIPAEQYG